MSAKELEVQLNSTLQASITLSLSSHRPLLTHLNADTTWLLSIPRPTISSKPTTTPQNKKQNRQQDGEQNPLHPGFLHVLIDPWLSGPQSDVAAFFSTQWHATPSCARDIADVEAIIARIDASARPSRSSSIFPNNKIRSDHGHENGSGISAVIISHEFTDHMHCDTLLTIANSVPIFATRKAASAIRGWGYFEKVVDIDDFGIPEETGKEIGQGVPDWLGVNRLAAEGDFLDYHSAVVITFPVSGKPMGSEKGKVGAREAVIYTPHGIAPHALQPFLSSDTETLALLHGLHDVSLGSQLNLGAVNGLRAQMSLGARYWVGTHDEVKRGGGLVSWFLKRKVIGVEEAVEKIEEELGEKGRMGDVSFVEVGNGESLLLE